MATHSSLLSWRIPRTEEPSKLQSTGSQSRTQLSTDTLIVGTLRNPKEDFMLPLRTGG